MLALTRKRGESIIIGDNIEIVVISIQGDQVKLGINAPRHIAVNRREIYEQIAEAKKASKHTAKNPNTLRDLNKLK